MMARIALAACLILLLGIVHKEPVGAQDIARLQAGVVKITAKPPSGPANVGTGFIVWLDKDAAYIVTAAHVVSGDKYPKVEFLTKRNMPVTAEVLGLEGDDEVRGLALLVVKGADTLPQGLTVLSLAGAVRLTGGEDILVIGFPRNAGPWAIVKGNISSRQGRDIYFTPSVESGHSGGPIFQGGKVVGVVGAGTQSVGRGVTVRSVHDYIEGFGITAQESTSIDITGKDGAPMVLVPAGEFTMGSREDDKTAQNDERPAHQVYLDAYYIDQYEVTTARYAKFFQETQRPPPKYWSENVLEKHKHKPVMGMDWSDATAYCIWVGKRLPTEAEWEKAARGIDQRLYPWGNEPPTKQRANFDQGTGGRFDSYKDYEALTDVGSFEQGKSPYGVFDMAGNVYEWTADWYEENYYRKSPTRSPKGPSHGEDRMLRGGSWEDGPDYVRSANRLGYPPVWREVQFGFRCAQDVPK